MDSDYPFGIFKLFVQSGWLCNLYIQLNSLIALLYLVMVNLLWFFNLPLAIVLSVLQFTDSDYPFGIFKLFLYASVFLVWVQCQPSHITGQALVLENALIFHIMHNIFNPRNTEVSICMNVFWLIPSFPHSWLTTLFLTRVTQWVPSMEQERITPSGET
jgi:hypothetical protein